MVFEVRGFGYVVSGMLFGVLLVECFGYVVSRFKVFKVRDLAYVVSGTGCCSTGFRVGGFEVRGFG